MSDKYSRDANRRGSDARSGAEAAFRKAITNLIEAAVPASAIPGAKELMSICIDRGVIEHLQADGPERQDRIDAALRTAAGLSAFHSRVLSRTSLVSTTGAT